MNLTYIKFFHGQQVARHLGAVKDTVYRWRERKGLPTHKIGRLCVEIPVI
ncbi:helix-turn-helix domain-containing protein [Acidithiobacillus sp.]